MLDELERRVADVLDVLERPRVQVVHADHPVPLGQQPVAQVGPEEARPPGYERSRHARTLTTESTPRHEGPQ